MRAVCSITTERRAVVGEHLLGEHHRRHAAVLISLSDFELCSSDHNRALQTNVRGTLKLDIVSIHIK